MVLLLCPRFKSVVVINSVLSALLLRPITNQHLHLGSVVIHYSTPLINNPHCIQLAEVRDREGGPQQRMKPTVTQSKQTQGSKSN